MLRKILLPLLIVAALFAAGQADAAACPTRHIHRITLPAVRVVQPYCTSTAVVAGHSRLPHVRHVTVENLGAYASPRGPEWIRYTLEAHTVSKAYRWHNGTPGPGWVRYTRRTATFTYDVRDLPDCAVGPGPAGA